MGKTIKYLLLGLLLYVLFMMATVPSDWVVSMVQDKVPGLKVSGASGTVWNGKAQMIRMSGQQVTDVTWSFKPLSLLTGHMAADLTVNDEKAKGKVTLLRSFGGDIKGRDIALAIPLQSLTQSLPMGRMMRGVTLKGTLKTQFDEVAWVDNALAAIDGTATIRSLHVDANIRQYQMKIDQVLGNYDLTFNTNDEKMINLDVKGKKDLLKLKLKGSRSPDRKLKLNGTIDANLPEEIAFVAMLPILKPADGGRKAFEYQGVSPF